MRNGLELSRMREREVLRYLGYRNRMPDQPVLEMVRSCMQEAAEKSQPRYIWRQFALTHNEKQHQLIMPQDKDGPFVMPQDKAGRFVQQKNDEKDDILQFAGMTIQSRSLSRNLKGCESVILFAATLGSGIDRLLGRYMRLQISKAAVFQAAAAEAIECFCDQCQEEIEALAEAEGLYVRPRFSPGYGDFSLTLQPAILEALEAGKQIGLYLSEGGVMLPEKSVTAVMGLGRERIGCVLQGCEACTKADCAYRRNEKEKEA